MNKRIRKKKRVGEFTEWGFVLSAPLAIGADHDDVLNLAIDAAEQNGLCIGGSVSNGNLSLFVTKRRAACTSDDQYRMIMLMGDNPTLVEEIRVGPLVDAWRPWRHKHLSGFDRKRVLVCNCQLEGSPDGCFMNPMWCRIHGAD